MSFLGNFLIYILVRGYPLEKDPITRSHVESVILLFVLFVVYEREKEEKVHSKVHAL